MKNREVLSTLFVGIDVSSRTNDVCAIDFDENRYMETSVSNNHPGALTLAEKLVHR